ncbi:MalY/PatB family protein [Blautia sp. Sow4_E7]|uniref:MalY/PatB family protein n=1 Tax=Blautia sp. Sow4_E7 TaxID=3438749 RepID=UPI003F8DF8DE
MSEQIPVIASNDGLYRLKWEYERERTSYTDLLCFGTADMDYRSPEPILDAMRGVLDRGHLGYPMIPERYYEVIHNWLLSIAGWDIDARCSIAQSAGIYMGAWAIISLLTRPQDMVTILTPVHFCYKEILRLNNRKIIECPLELIENGYSINFGRLEACFASGSRLLWLCNPHNPIGHAWTKAELEKIAELCLKYQVYIISDDVYCGLLFSGTSYTPIASLSKEISRYTVTLYSTSKTYNTAALRHAFLVTENPEIYKKYREFLTSMSMDYGQNIMGIEATIAALGECEEWRRKVMEKIMAAHRFLEKYFEENMPMCKVIKSDSSYFAWIDMRALKIQPQMLTHLLEQEEHMIVENGYFLGKGGAGFIRFNLACDEEHLKEGAARLKEFCFKHI